MVAAFAHGFTFQRFYRTVHEIGGGSIFVVPYNWLQVRSHSKTMTHFEGACLVN